MSDDLSNRLIMKVVSDHAALVEALQQINDMIAGCPDAPLAPDSLPQMVLAVVRATLAKVGEPV